MHDIPRRISLPLLFGSALVLGCVTEPGPETREPIQFIVGVDRAAHPSIVSVGDTVAIRLYGTIGTSGCYSFSHIEDSQQPLQLDLTVWGQLLPANACTAVMVYLDRQYEFVATQNGVYLINIYEPDGTVLQDSVIIQG